LDRVEVSQVLGNDSGENWKQGNARNTFQDITDTVGSEDTLVSMIPFNSLSDSPFWVGQKIRVTATHSDGGGSDLTDVIRRITAIAWDPQASLGATTGRIILTLNSAIGTLASGKTYSAITCDGVDSPFTSGLIVNNANLVLEKLAGSKKVKDQITYTEYSNEQFSANNVQYLQRMFELEPNCVNVFIMNNADIMSKQGTITDYRLRLDNKDLTNRNIVPKSPLYYDRLNMTLGNSSNTLKNLNEKTASVTSVGNPNPGDKWGTGSVSTIMMCNPVPQTPMPKQLQVNINLSTASLKQLCIFKEVVKVI
jgi:hypothetical protein